MRCRLCDMEKEPEDFVVNRKLPGGRERRCKDCRNARRREHYGADSDARTKRSQYVMEHRRRKKAKLVAEFGGECVMCGYDQYQGALQFHHRDPATKQFEVNGGSSKGLGSLREEAKKCVLLCANCHAEIEGGFSTLIGEPN